MRIEKVLIHNINSLAGTFEIDFTKKEYAEGLVAIVGPSGAGKSTVFDAVCLALYGKTPRISAISETHNEIMTKSESECGAQVVFWSRGKKYKAAFSHKRAKGQNPFGQVKRELIEYESEKQGRIIASMIKEVTAKITQITGLSYNQFTRSIMLAQFEFTEFLKADSNTRAGILEQISDMDIYRSISIAVFQRAKEKEASLFEIRTKIDTINVLDDVHRKELENEAKQLIGAIAEHSELGGKFAFCGETIKKINELQEALSKHEQEKKRLEKELFTQNKNFESAKTGEQKTKQRQAELHKTLKIVRELDNKIAVEKTNIKRIENEIDGDEKKILQNKIVIRDLFKKYMPDADNAKLKSLYDMHGAADILRAEAKADLKGATDKEKNLRGQMEKALSGKDEAYWQQRADLLEIALPIAQAQREVMLAQVRQDGLHKKARKLEEKEKEQNAKKQEIEEKLLLARLEEKFGQERGRLEDGKPCPLCGALKHPGIDTGYTAKVLHDINAQKIELTKSMEKIKRDIIDNKSSLAAEEKLVKEKTSIINEGKARLKNMGKKLEDVGIDLIDDAAAQNIEKSLSEAKDIIRKYSALLKEHSRASGEVTKFTRQLGDIEKDVLIIDSNKQTIKDTEQRNSERQAAKTKAAEEYERLKAERIKLFGQKSADEEEEKAAKKAEDAHKFLEACREKSGKAKGDAQQNKNDIERTKKDIELQNTRLGAAYKQAVQDADRVCKTPVFGDDDIKKLFEDVCDILKRLSDDVAQSADAVDSISRALSAMSAKQTERKGRIAQQLEANEQRKKQLSDMRKQEKSLKKTYEKWSRLNALIGSATGDKFSRMAQGITFEVLLQYANANLSKMSDRYLLMRDSSNSSKPLEISVLDNYQAGDIRPVSNLSGGESFIVSMALALGLSEMSSNKTRIDSLFIDEGFASLDEDYLEAALQTLSSLGNRENKLVGVISHVGALKERINVKIQVDKLSGGRSTLSGPGVTVG